MCVFIDMCAEKRKTIDISAESRVGRKWRICKNEKENWTCKSLGGEFCLLWWCRDLRFCWFSDDCGRNRCFLSLSLLNLVEWWFFVCGSLSTIGVFDDYFLNITGMMMNFCHADKRHAIVFIHARYGMSLLKKN